MTNALKPHMATTSATAEAMSRMANHKWQNGTPSRSVSPEICLEDHYAAAALTGLLAAQRDAPSKEWAGQWALELGAKMAREAKRRRRRR